MVLSGPPGVGKSQLAQSYAAVHRGEFDTGWWVVAEDRLAVVTELAVLAHRLGVGDGDQEVAAERAVAWLNGSSRWLLVFDNVEAEADLEGLVPSAGGRVGGDVAGSGPGTVGPGGGGGPVRARPGGELPVRPGPAGCSRLMLLPLGSLATEVGGLPLALEQAAAYCAQSGIGLAAYLGRYRSGGRSVLWGKGAPQGRDPVGRTFELAFQAVAQRDEAAVQLLTLLAFFAPATGVPRWVLQAAASKLPSALARAADDPMRLDATVPVLVRLSLIQADGESLRVHPRVQELLRTSITQNDRRWLKGVLSQSEPLRRFNSRRWDTPTWLDTAAATLLAATPATTGDPARLGPMGDTGTTLLDSSGLDRAHRRLRNDRPPWWPG